MPETGAPQLQGASSTRKKSNAAKTPLTAEDQMDIQKMFNAVSNLSLGSLIANLGASPEDKPVFLDSGGSVNRPHSYRGYYSDLALRPTEDAVTAGALLAECQAVLGTTLEGYKGGDFLMDEETPLWVSNYGTSSGLALTGVVDAGNKLILVTKQIVD